MLDVNFAPRVHTRINRYSDHYREYCCRLFEDSGIWSEDIIIQEYFELADSRKREIYKTVTDRLSGDTVLGNSGKNTVKIPWRTKMLHVTYEDISDEERIITDLEILTQ